MHKSTQWIVHSLKLCTNLYKKQFITWSYVQICIFPCFDKIIITQSYEKYWLLIFILYSLIFQNMNYGKQFLLTIVS